MNLADLVHFTISKSDSTGYIRHNVIYEFIWDFWFSFFGYTAEVSHNISETDLVSGKWKVKQFMKKLGKKPNSKNMDLNNCALNETDLMELSKYTFFHPYSNS